MQIADLEPGVHESRGHFVLRIHALLTEHCHTGLRAEVDHRSGNVILRIKRRVDIETGIFRILDTDVFRVRAFRIIAVAGNLPGDFSPRLLQRGARLGVDFLPVHKNHIAGVAAKPPSERSW